MRGHQRIGTGHHGAEFTLEGLLVDAMADHAGGMAFAHHRLRLQYFPQLGTHLLQRPEHAADFVIAAYLDLAVQAAAGDIARDLRGRSQRTAQQLAHHQHDQGHHRRQCQRRDQRDAQHQAVEHLVQHRLRFKAQHQPLPRAVALRRDKPGLLGAASGRAQVQARLRAAAVQQRLQRGQILRGHLFLQYATLAFGGGQHAAALLACAGVHHDEAPFAAQRGLAQARLQRGQALRIVLADEGDAGHTAIGGADRHVVGHVIGAEQVRRTGVALPAQHPRIRRIGVVKYGTQHALALRVAQRRSHAHEIIAIAHEHCRHATGGVGEAIDFGRRRADGLASQAQGRRAAADHVDGRSAIGLCLALRQHRAEGAGDALGALAQAAVVQLHRIAHQHGGGIQAGAHALLVAVGGIAVDQDRQRGESDGGDRGHQQRQPRGDGQRTRRRRGGKTGCSGGHHGETDPWKGALESVPC